MSTCRRLQAEEDEEAVVVVDLDKAFADLLIDTPPHTEGEPLLSTSSTSSKSLDATTGVNGVVRRGGHLPPLIHISSLTKSSTNSVYQLCQDDNIALTPSPRPSLWDDKSGQDRMTQDRTAHRRYSRRTRYPL